MAIPTRMPRRPAAVIVAIVLSAIAAEAASQAGADRLLPVGHDTLEDYRLDADSIQRDGSTVRFHLIGTSPHPDYGGDYDGQVLVDCASHQRREMGAVIRYQRGVETHNRPDKQMREVFAGTRQDAEMRLVCRLAGVPVPAVAVAAATPPAPEPAPSPAPAPALAPSPAPAPAQGGQFEFAPVLPSPTWSAALPNTSRPVARAAEPPPHPPGRPFTLLSAADLQATGSEAQVDYAILVDSVRHKGAVASYLVQVLARGAKSATREHWIADCGRHLRAFQPEDSPPGARLTAYPVQADTRAAREMATACAMADGPRNRWFAGFVVTADGVVVAPRERTMGCAAIVARVGTQRRRATLVAQEPGVSVLRLDGGGPWTFMPSVGVAASLDHAPVTMLGVLGTAPRVSAAFVQDAGSNADDSGWPQVTTLPDAALSEGIVWNGSGAAVGLAMALRPPDRRGTRSYVRMLPVSEIRNRLRGHGIQWDTSDGGGLDAEAAMRRAVSATLPLTCENGP